jgi:hypothetical protein
MWFSLTGIKMSYEREIRYQEDGDKWSAITYTASGNSRSEGLVGYQPAWLQLILDVAKMGGHLTRLRDGPPDHLLWVTIDDDNNLLEITFP